MSLTRPQLISTIDQLSHVRDLNAVALMACADLDDHLAKSALSQLLGLILDQIDTIGDQLNKAHRGVDNDPA